MLLLLFRPIEPGQRPGTGLPFNLAPDGYTRLGNLGALGYDHDACRGTD